jgi:predicted DNA-binding protein with PD1-like motif
MLPDETIVAEPFEVEAFGIDGAMFTAEPDSETNFKLFGPVAAASTGARATSRVFALRLRPNQDFAGCLETFCRAHGIARAKIHGGVGSTIGARFTHGGVTEPFATELAITAGTIVPGTSGALEAALDVALIDYTGGITEGRLIRGDNPVLMTMELVLEVLG